MSNIDTEGWDPNFKPDCTDGSVDGIISKRFDYIVKGLTPSYPNEACTPYLHGNYQADNVKVNDDVTIGGNTVASGNVTVNGRVTINNDLILSGVGNAASYMQTTRAIASSKKGFDISHPTKKNHRLRYICIEGPSAEVYFRGRIKDTNIIEIPEHWATLVDLESIDIYLTPIACYQELFVEKIEWGKRIIIKNNAGGAINCSYIVYGERVDGEKNIPEYEGMCPEDYPGDNTEYTINGL
jgi:hypothetical protein